MKYSEELKLRLNGVKSEEIKAMKEQEEKELAEEAAAAAAKKQEDEEKEASALEIAQSMIKDLEAKLEAKEDELTKLNKEFADLNNARSLSEKTEEKYNASSVMGELFNKN